MDAFTIREPTAKETPLIVEIPHAGLVVPEPFAQMCLASPHAVKRDADLHVDALYADAPSAGAHLLCAKVSRYVVDLNRSEADIDGESVEGAKGSSAPRGVVWRLTTDGTPCLPRPLTRAELEARLVAIHRPYHAALDTLVSDKIRKFGHAVILAAHSMPSVGRAGHGDSGSERADVVPGTQGRTTADPRIIDAIDALAQSASCTVRHDDPYRGGYTTRHYGRPGLGMHAIQIELSRKLYMDEETLVPNSSFPRVRALCQKFAQTLADLALR